MPNSKFLDIND